ncbi:hypothetical protein [Niveispirillum lacus]|nr:hypothetical protein [Niveispirillum lacus]
MSGQGGFWDFEDRLRQLSATVDFEQFRPVLAKALRRGGLRRGGRSPAV